MKQPKRLKTIGFSLLALGLGLLPTVVHPSAQAQETQAAPATPPLVRWVTADVDNFWKAIDLAEKDPGPVPIIQSQYFDQGSPGLKNFIAIRIGSAQELWDKYQSRKEFYQAIRQTTLAVSRSSTVRTRVTRNLEKLRELYPEAKFSDIYMVVGKMNSAGRIGDNGVTIAVELFSKTNTIPLTGLSPWERSALQGQNQMAFRITHEFAHGLQDQAGLNYSGPQTLLKQALTEGGADFIASLASGDKPSLAYFSYGLLRERELWLAFTRDMNATDVSKWLYQDSVSERPGDLGYFVGYRIAEAYYAQAKDKPAAIKDLLEIKRPEQILALSGYARKFSGN